MGKHRSPAARDTRTLSGVVRQHNFRPKGEIEGIVLDTSDGPAQVNFPQGPERAATTLLTGATVRLVVGPDHRAHTPEPGDHPVYEFVAEAGPEPAGAPAAEGVVVRFNYARHGEPNGVVLDTGDFVHLKPHGMRLVALAVGAPARAEGALRPTVTGHRVIEATVVNCVVIASKKPPHEP